MPFSPGSRSTPLMQSLKLSGRRKVKLVKTRRRTRSLMRRRNKRRLMRRKRRW